MNRRIDKEYFLQQALFLAQNLLGKYLVRVFDNGETQKYIISETEAYIGEEDLACHASKGRTKRTEIMYEEGGKVYVYLIYGKHWLLNIVTGEKNCPQAVLIRGVQGCSGPGRVGKLLELDKSFYGEDLVSSYRIWIEDSLIKPSYISTPRIGIEYAGDIWKNKPWRFILDN